MILCGHRLLDHFVIVGSVLLGWIGVLFQQLGLESFLLGF